MSGIALGPSLRQLVERPSHGHLVTVDADGCPLMAIVWVGVDGDELFRHTSARGRR